MKTLALRARVFIHCFLVFGYPGETRALVVHILHIGLRSYPDKIVCGKRSLRFSLSIFISKKCSHNFSRRSLSDVMLVVITASSYFCDGRMILNARFCIFSISSHKYCWIIVMSDLIRVLQNRSNNGSRGNEVLLIFQGCGN